MTKTLDKNKNKNKKRSSTDREFLEVLDQAALQIPGPRRRHCRVHQTFSALSYSYSYS